MSANLQEVQIIGRTFANLISLPVGGSFFVRDENSVITGEIPIDVTLEETHNDSLQVTEHPVQKGASISDHAYKRPTEVVLRCGWSNSSFRRLVHALTDAATGATMAISNFVPGSQVTTDIVGGIYSQLLKLQQSRNPFTISTSLRVYDSMLMTSLSVTRDQQTSSALMVTATCREIIVVDTLSTTLPPPENHADPESTAEVEQGGHKFLIPFAGPR